MVPGFKDISTDSGYSKATIIKLSQSYQLAYSITIHVIPYQSSKTTKHFLDLHFNFVRYRFVNLPMTKSLFYLDSFFFTILLVLMSL